MPAKKKAKKVKKIKKAKKVKPKKKKAIKKVKKKIQKAAPKKPSVPSNEKPVGLITHYFPHVSAGVIKIKKDSVSVGDVIHIKGATTDFKQQVASLQIDHVPVQSAGKGKEIGIQTQSRVRQGDTVYRVLPLVK